MKEKLSRVYFDDYPVTLMGDEAQPPLSRIVRAGGKLPDRVDVVYLTSPSDDTGRPVGIEEIIDRTVDPVKPIYLRSIPKPAARPMDAGDSDVVLPPPGKGAPASPPLAPPAPYFPNADRIISQLGVEPRHEPGVFRSPSQMAPATPLAPVPAAVAPLKRSRQVQRAEALAAAEAEAEQRQEEDREQAGVLQDEQEAQDDADDDFDSQN